VAQCHAASTLTGEQEQNLIESLTLANTAKRNGGEDSADVSSDLIIFTLKVKAFPGQNRYHGAFSSYAAWPVPQVAFVI
jgi:hypothetical protein